MLSLLHSPLLQSSMKPLLMGTMRSKKSLLLSSEQQMANIQRQVKERGPTHLNHHNRLLCLCHPSILFHPYIPCLPSILCHPSIPCHPSSQNCILKNNLSLWTLRDIKLMGWQLKNTVLVFMHCLGMYMLFKVRALNISVSKQWAKLMRIRQKLTCWQGSWYHLRRVVSGNEVHIACGCPSGHYTLVSLACVHERYVRENYEKKELLQQGQEDGMFLLSSHGDLS